MCGIVGLLLKKSALHAQLGELMVPMLIGMTDRGPDSAGMAVFTTPLPEGRRKISLYSGLTERRRRLRLASADRRTERRTWMCTPTSRPTAITPSSPSTGAVDAVKNWLKAQAPKLHACRPAAAIDLYKDIGKPAEVAQRYAFART